MVERIEKIRSEGTITLETLDKVLERLGAELVIALREEVPDEDARTADPPTCLGTGGTTIRVRSHPISAR